VRRAAQCAHAEEIVKACEISTKILQSEGTLISCRRFAYIVPAPQVVLFKCPSMAFAEIATVICCCWLAFLANRCTRFPTPLDHAPLPPESPATPAGINCVALCAVCVSECGLPRPPAQSVVHMSAERREPQLPGTQEGGARVCARAHACVHASSSCIKVVSSSTLVCSFGDAFLRQFKSAQLCRGRRVQNGRSRRWDLFNHNSSAARVSGFCCRAIFAVKVMMIQSFITAQLSVLWLLSFFYAWVGSLGKHNTERPDHGHSNFSGRAEIQQRTAASCTAIQGDRTLPFFWHHWPECCGLSAPSALWLLFLALPIAYFTLHQYFGLLWFFRVDL